MQVANRITEEQLEELAREFARVTPHFSAARSRMAAAFRRCAQIVENGNVENLRAATKALE